MVARPSRNGEELPRRALWSFFMSDDLGHTWDTHRVSENDVSGEAPPA